MLHVLKLSNKKHIEELKQYLCCIREFIIILDSRVDMASVCFDWLINYLGIVFTLLVVAEATPEFYYFIKPLR